MSICDTMSFRWKDKLHYFQYEHSSSNVPSIEVEMKTFRLNGVRRELASVSVNQAGIADVLLRYMFEIDPDILVCFVWGSGGNYHLYQNPEWGPDLRVSSTTGGYKIISEILKFPHQEYPQHEAQVGPQYTDLQGRWLSTEHEYLAREALERATS